MYKQMSNNISLSTLLILYHKTHQENVEDEIEKKGDNWVKKYLPELTKWEQLEEEDVTASHLFRYGIPLSAFSHLTPKYDDMYKLIIGLDIKLKHLKGRKFFDPQYVVGTIVEEGDIYRLDKGLRKTYNKTANEPLKKYKIVKYHSEDGVEKVKELNLFLKYNDFYKIGWNYNDMVIMGVDYTFLSKSGLKNADTFQSFTKNHGLDAKQWKELGLTEEKKKFLL